MGEINQYVVVSIDRNSKTPSQASFGIPGVIGQFAASKTVELFARARTYRNLRALEADGFTSADSIHAACSAIFRQRPSVEKVLVGRIDSGDASIGASLSAIAEASSDLFGFTVVGTYTSSVALSQALITGNVVKSSYSGVAVADVTYSGSPEATMTAWKGAIEAALPGATATVSGTSMAVVWPGNDPVPVVSVTGGASQPTVSVSWTQDLAKVEAIADWAETQKKPYIYDTTDIATYGGGSSDIFSTLKAKGYDWSCGWFHKLPGEYFAASLMGEGFAYDPGSSTYAFRTLKGVTSDNLGTTKEDRIVSKNGGYYTTTAGISHTFEGKVASGEFLDVMIGIAWVESRIKERVFAGRVNSRRVGLSDPGLETEGTLIKAVLSEAEQKGIGVRGTASVTVPKAADIATADKAARYAPGFEFGLQVEGAIHKSKINGHLYL